LFSIEIGESTFAKTLLVCMTPQRNTQQKNR
jgi:hypothetical protein